MGEISEYFKNKYFKNNNTEAKEYMHKQKVKNSILSLCDSYLVEAEDVLEFEATGKDLTYAVIVINEEPLRSKFVISQITDTTFYAKLREIEL